jgi:hypothetical protein
VYYPLKLTYFLFSGVSYHSSVVKVLFGSPTQRPPTKIPMPSHFCSDIGCLRDAIPGTVPHVQLSLIRHYFGKITVVLSVFYYTRFTLFVKSLSIFIRLGFSLLRLSSVGKPLAFCFLR